jgi:hypothetical protein
MDAAMSNSDATFLASVGIKAVVEADLPRPAPCPRSEPDFYEAFTYWREQALRYERIATYAWGAWLILASACCIAAMCWLTSP